MRAIFTFAVFLVSWHQFAQGGGDIIIEYTPVQSNIVGKTLTTYTKGGQVLFGSSIPGIQTSDEDSSTEEIKKFKQRLNLSLTNIFRGENVREVSVEAYNVKVTNINSPVENLPTGRIIMSGLKADSVTITITKKNNYNLSAKELIQKIKSFSSIPTGSVVNSISLLDSLNYLSNKTFKLTIKNPNVFYSFIAGQVTKAFASNAYVDIERQLGQIVLKPNSTTDRVTPKSSDEFKKIGFARAFKLRYDENNGEKKLWVLATREGGGVDSLEVQKSGNKWSSTGLLFNSTVLGKVTKKYYVDIEAHLDTDNTTLIIDTAEIRYPEWVFNAIPRKRLI